MTVNYRILSANNRGKTVDSHSRSRFVKRKPIESTFELTRSASDTVSTIGLSLSSMTFVPIGAFSSTKPSILDAVITGGLLSTGLTVIVNFAVAERFASDTSTALKKKRKDKWNLLRTNSL